MPITITTSTTVTANDIIRRACLALGYLGRTETLSAADAVDGLNAFNTMLDSWSNDNLYAYLSIQRNFTLTIGQQAYTIGESGSPDINTARPFSIEQAFLLDSNNNRYPLTIIPQAQWDLIGDITITSQLPDTLFYYPSFPNGVINIFPVPSLAYSVYYDSTYNQVPFTLLTQALTMPLGYERAYVLNLALELVSAGFPCMLDDKSYMRLMENASEAKANIKRTNMVAVPAEIDQSIVVQSDATYNIYSDGYTRVR